MEETNKTKDKEGQGVSDYLVGPKKKRKSYILLATHPNFDSDIVQTVGGYIKSAFQQYAMAIPRSKADFAKQYVRQISLVVIDDMFAGSRLETLKLVKALKEKKHNATFPVLFLTEEPKALISDYNANMLTYHEMDDYVAYTDSSTPQIQSRIKVMLESANKRRTRRFKIDKDITLHLLNSDKPIKAHIIDMSLHGALIKIDSNLVFNVSDQMRIQLDGSKFLSPAEGEFIKVAARVRRVFIGGNVAGVSFEYLTEKQITLITSFLAGFGDLAAGVKPV
jgi:hypothetical protein